MLGGQRLEAAEMEEMLDILLPEIDEMPGHVDAVPAFSKQHELPAGDVRHLDDQTPVRTQQFARPIQIFLGFIQMLQDMKHRDCRTALAAKRCFQKIGADRGDSVTFPGNRRGRSERIQAQHGKAGFTQHAEEQTAASTDIQDKAGLLRRANRVPDKMQVIAQNESTVRFDPFARRALAGIEPITFRVISRKFFGRWPGIETDQTAGPAFHNAKNFRRGLIKPIGYFEKYPEIRIAASRTARG